MRRRLRTSTSTRRAARSSSTAPWPKSGSPDSESSKDRKNSVDRILKAPVRSGARLPAPSTPSQASPSFMPSFVSGDALQSAAAPSGNAGGLLELRAWQGAAVSDRARQDRISATPSSSRSLRNTWRGKCLLGDAWPSPSQFAQIW